MYGFEQFTNIVQDAFYSMLSIQNWNLINQASKYGGASSSVSPFQHFWTLSVEDQIYFFFPLILLGVFLIAIRFKLNRHFVGFSLVIAFCSSFCYSIILSLSNNSYQYFSTATRFWEFLAGALLVYDSTKIHGKLLRGGLIVSLFLLGLSLVVSGSTQNYPGYMALMPVMSTLLFIKWDNSSSSKTKKQFFVHLEKCLVWVGDRSYSLYLIHWPVIIFYRRYNNSTSWISILTMLALMLFLANISYIYLEQSMLKSSKTNNVGKSFNIWNQLANPIFAYIAGFAVLITMFFTLSGSHFDSQNKVPSDLSIGEPVISGKISSPKIQVKPNSDNEVTSQNSITKSWESLVFESSKLKVVPDDLNPSISELTKERLKLWETCMKPMNSTGLSCTMGDSKLKKIVLIGDSTARSTLPMIQAFADENQYSIYGFINEGCQLSSLVDYDTNFPKSMECRLFYKNSINAINDLRPKLLVVVSDNGSVQGFQTQDKELIIRNGLDYFFSSLQLNTSRTILVSSLSKQQSLITCISRTQQILNSCFSKHKDFQWLTAIEVKSAKKHGVDFFNLNSLLCTRIICPPIIDSTPVYYDGAHLTSEMARKVAVNFTRFVSDS